jgi:hypothetical protein
MQQKMTSYISLKNNIPAVNGTGLILLTQPVHEVTEDYSTKMFSKEYQSKIAHMKKECEEESKLLVFAPSLGVWGLLLFKKIYVVINKSMQNCIKLNT